VIDGSTITAKAGAFAFDVCRYSSYPSVSVTVKGESVINGDIEVSASNNDPKDGFGLTLEAGTFNGNIVLAPSAEAVLSATPEKAVIKKSNSLTTVAAPQNYKWVDNNDQILPGKRSIDFKVPMEAAKVTVAQVYSAPMGYNFKNDAALDAASYILDMRYVTSLREEEGGTYGAHSSVSLSIIPKAFATLQVVFDTNPESADKLRALAVDGLKAFAKDGPTPEEFDMAVKNLLKNIPEQRVTNRYWAGVLRQNNDYGFDADVEREKAIRELKPADVQQVLNNLLGSGNFAEIIMRAE
jgi:hypothetical protein